MFFVQLQEKLRDTEDILNNSQQKLQEIEKERDVLFHQLSLNAPQVCQISIFAYYVSFLIDINHPFKSINRKDKQLSLMSILESYTFEENYFSHLNQFSYQNS